MLSSWPHLLHHDLNVASDYLRPSRFNSRPLSLGNSWMTTSSHRNFFPLASWLEPISSYSWCPSLFLYCTLPGLAPVFQCSQLHNQNGNASQISRQSAAQSAFILHFLDSHSSLPPSNPDPTGINIVRTEFISFLSQPDPLLAIPTCPSSFPFPTSGGDGPQYLRSRLPL